MVEQTIRTAFKAEHKLERLSDDIQGKSNDITDKELQEIKMLSEQAAIAAAKGIDQWGKAALVKVKDFTEDISL